VQRSGRLTGLTATTMVRGSMRSTTLSSRSMSGSVTHQTEPMCKASSGTAQTSAPSAVTTELSLRLQGRTFGAPGLTARDVHASRREQPRESRAPGMAGRGGQGCRGSRRCGAAASLASFGRMPCGRGGCRARLPRHRPQPVPAVTSPRCHATRTGRGRRRRARYADRRAKVTVTGTPRIVRVGPSSLRCFASALRADAPSARR
jgi:hypothetical protein